MGGSSHGFSGGITVPTYAYACKDCQHAFDIQQSFTDDALTVCPECSGTLRKKFNSVGVVFKGSGFYRTDSRDAKGSGTLPSATAKKEAASAAPAAAASAPAPAKTTAAAS
jgi:putative FmdB family regulatory protein